MPADYPTFPVLFVDRETGDLQISQDPETLRAHTEEFWDILQDFEIVDASGRQVHIDEVFLRENAGISVEAPNVERLNAILSNFARQHRFEWSASDGIGVFFRWFENLRR